jgi:hypothetical protein
MSTQKSRSQQSKDSADPEYELPPLDTNTLSQRAKQLVGHIQSETVLQSILQSLTDATTTLDLIRESTSIDELQSNIETISQHRARDTNAVIDARDALQARLDTDSVFSVTLTDPDTEFLDPMVVLETPEESIQFTNDPVVNAEMLSKAVKGDAVTASGQRRRREQWATALDPQSVRQLKQGTHPDFLGFSLPESVPATGNSSSHTSVTELTHIGPARAETLHPTGDLMALRDFTDLTRSQMAHLEPPLHTTALSNDRVTALVSDIIEYQPPSVAATTAGILGLLSHSHSDDSFMWMGDGKLWGFASSPQSLVKNNTYHPLAKTEKYIADDTGDQYVTLSNVHGSQTTMTSQLYQGFKQLARHTQTPILCGDTTPVTVQVAPKEYLVVSPVANPP